MKLIKIFLLCVMITFCYQACASNIIEKYSYKISSKFSYYLGDYLPQEMIDFIKEHPHISSATIIALSAGIGYQTYAIIPYLYKSLPIIFKVDSFLNSSDKSEINRINEYYEYQAFYSEIEDAEFRKEAQEIDNSILTF